MLIWSLFHVGDQNEHLEASWEAFASLGSEMLKMSLWRPPGKHLPWGGLFLSLFAVLPFIPTHFADLG